jgi:predicted dienelactone hydrolase
MVAEGVFPLVVFIHGTGGWRTNSANIIHRWVSRGFIVVSADYPGIGR